MEILIERHFSCSEYVLGRCYVGDTYFCDTLESPVTGVKHPCIPVGDYLVNLVWSPKFKSYKPRLEGVPHRSGIFIHKGNSVKDASGFILVGSNSFKGHLTQSLLAYSDLLECMTKAVLYADKITVRIINV